MEPNRFGNEISVRIRQELPNWGEASALSSGDGLVRVVFKGVDTPQAVSGALVLETGEILPSAHFYAIAGDERKEDDGEYEARRKFDNCIFTLFHEFTSLGVRRKLSRRLVPRVTHPVFHDPLEDVKHEVSTYQDQDDPR